MGKRESPGEVLHFCQKLAKDLGLKFDQWNFKNRLNNTKDQRNTKILVADLGNGKGWKSRLGIENIFSRKRSGHPIEFSVDVKVGFLIETNFRSGKGLPLEFVIDYECYPHYEYYSDPRYGDSSRLTCVFDVFLSELTKDIQQLIKESPAIIERIIKSKTFTDFSEASVLNWLGHFIKGVFCGMDIFVLEMGKSQDKNFAISPDFSENILTEDERRTLEGSNLLPLIKQMLKSLSSLANFTPEQDRAHGEILRRCSFPNNDREITPLDRYKKKLEKSFVDGVGELLKGAKHEFKDLRRFSTYIGTGISNGHFNHWDTERYDRKPKDKEDNALVYKREATIE